MRGFSDPNRLDSEITYFLKSTTQWRKSKVYVISITFCIDIKMYRNRTTRHTEALQNKEY